MTQAGANFEVDTVTLPDLSGDPKKSGSLGKDVVEERKQLGSVRGLFPVLHVEDTSIYESLAICEYIAELYPQAHLWPEYPLDRARARSICNEMTTGFMALRGECSCHLSARVPKFTPRDPEELQADIDRVLEVWTECLERSGGPYLFGEHFGIADAMYYPVLTRFWTYGVVDFEKVDDKIKAYAKVLEADPTVKKLVEYARNAPAIPKYDEYIRMLGGDPNKAM
eukprot:CAMPEP_0197438180 /NCGR_PEP_ID=MMETSP1175-20131217/5248_1 /TAXON_ID=1003142 /ORGANISM="Triceratium dubium, Strain CCMP147" /LENGTH=224 /DNA_ID=CAMNT_0042967859 /DNA_START=86 /DNA_END=760 /DNA_ORIENTATION=+